MKSLKKVAPLVAVLAAIVALVMVFLPALVVEDETYNGIKAIFGHSEQVLGSLKTEILCFSIMNLLTYVLVIVGGFCAFLSAKNPKKTISSFLAAICLLAAGILFFFTVDFTVLGETLAQLGTAKDYGFELGVGAIIGGIVSIIGALFASVPAVSKMLK